MWEAAVAARARRAAPGKCVRGHAHLPARTAGKAPIFKRVWLARRRSEVEVLLSLFLKLW